MDVGRLPRERRVVAQRVGRALGARKIDKEDAAAALAAGRASVRCLYCPRPQWFEAHVVERVRPRAAGVARRRRGPARARRRRDDGRELRRRAHLDARRVDAHAAGRVLAHAQAAAVAAEQVARRRAGNLVRGDARDEAAPRDEAAAAAAVAAATSSFPSEQQLAGRREQRAHRVRLARPGLAEAAHGGVGAAAGDRRERLVEADARDEVGVACLLG